MLFVPHGVTGQSAAQLLEYLTIYLREHDGAMHLTGIQAGQLFEGAATLFVILRQHAERHQYLVGMQAGILAC